MVDINYLKDFLSIAGEPGSDDSVREALGEVEAILCDTDLAGKRLEYLLSLKKSAYESGDKRGDKPIRLIPNPLSEEDTKILIEKGIGEACKSGSIEPGKIFRLMHSIDGLTLLNERLAEIPFEKYAPCWQNAVLTAAKAGAADLDKVFEAVGRDRTRTDSGKASWILYVDDIEAEADAVTEIFKSRFGDRFRVRGFTSPGAALDFVRHRIESGHEFALVVTDMYMPEEFHGDRLATELHLIDPSIPVLGYSGHNNYQDPEQAKRAGLVDLLSKQTTETSFLLDTVATLVKR